ncbi:MAG: YihY/virulence factor BrkB family protein [Acetobacteraceae bacterium]
MSTSSRLEELKQDVAAHTGPTEAQQRASDAKLNRGRSADTPTQIPAAGWKDIALRTYKEIGENNLFLVAGGVTYALLLAMFPALAALVALYGLLFNPAQVEQQINSLSAVLPPQTTELVGTELHNLVEASGKSLGIGAIVALLFALWSASRGMSGLITAFNIAYRQQESRSFIRFNMIALGLTIAGLVGGVIIIALVGVLPAAIQFVGLGVILKWVILIVQWPILIAVVMVCLAVLYRYAPNRSPAKWRWVSPGAIVATILWLIGSIAFSIYVSNFNSYNATYGSLGGVVILLTWLYLSSFVALLGAVINAQAERQTRHDSTEKPDQPLGQRGAYAADTVGETTG